MPLFHVYWATTASTVMQVEAENYDEARDIAYDTFEPPSIPHSLGWDMGDWDLDSIEKD